MQAARKRLGVHSEGGVELIFETSVHEESKKHPDGELPPIHNGFSWIFSGKLRSDCHNNQPNLFIKNRYQRC